MTRAVWTGVGVDASTRMARTSERRLHNNARETTSAKEASIVQYTEAKLLTLGPVFRAETL